MPIARNNKGMIQYRFRPQTTTAIAKVEGKVATLKLQKKVIDSVVKGETYEAIAEKNGITEEEAFKMAREVIAKWAGPLANSATEAKELDLKRLDAMLVVIQPEVFPEPYFDLESGGTITPKPNPVYIKLYLDIIAARRAMLGTDAAKKLDVVDPGQVLRREYIGVNPDAL